MTKNAWNFLITVLCMLGLVILGIGISVGYMTNRETKKINAEVGRAPVGISTRSNAWKLMKCVRECPRSVQKEEIEKCIGACFASSGCDHSQCVDEVKAAVKNAQDTFACIKQTKSESCLAIFQCESGSLCFNILQKDIIAPALPKQQKKWEM